MFKKIFNFNIKKKHNSEINQNLENKTEDSENNQNLENKTEDSENNTSKKLKNKNTLNKIKKLKASLSDKLNFNFLRYIPFFEIIWSNAPLAIIVTDRNELKPQKIHIVLDKFFLTTSGWFILSYGNSFSIFKQHIYLYDASNVKPMTMKDIRLLEKIAKKNPKYFLYCLTKFKKTKITNEYNPYNDIEQLPIMPTTFRKLLKYSGADPQEIVTGIKQILAINKLFNKRASHVVQQFPIKYALIAVGVILLLLLVAPEFTGSFDSVLDTIPSLNLTNII